MFGIRIVASTVPLRTVGLLVVRMFGRKTIDSLTKVHHDYIIAAAAATDPSCIINPSYAMEKPKEELLHLSFNQDQSYLAVGTETGFKVFKCSPFKELFAREFGSGIGIVEMINRTNILAIVGGGKTPRYPKNKLMIWDDCKQGA